jgi:hypothetical protein
MKLIAIRDNPPFRKAGDRFEKSPAVAKVMVHCRLAAYDETPPDEVPDEEEEPEQAPVPEEEPEVKSKRRYKRRDLQAES